MDENTSTRHEIAGRIVELRDAVGMTVEEVAGRMDISPEKYKEYENGAVDVPISALYEISGLFRVDMTDLMTGKSPNLQQYCVVRDGRGPQIERYPGYRFQSLAYDFQNRMFEPLLVTIDPEKNNSIGLVSHGGQEFNIVLSGAVRVIHGGHTIDLNAGDSIFFDPTVPHAQQALNDNSATFLTVIMHEK